VLRWDEYDIDVLSERMSTPSVLANNFRGRDGPANDCVVAQGHYNNGGITVDQLPQHSDVQMVIVVVTEQNGINSRKIVKGNGGLTNAFRA
jgi:hypothetical protein